MRCDVNISIHPVGTDTFGTRTEIKNMNSLSFIEKAMQYEYERQCDILDSGKKVEQATMRFDEHTGETSVMRTKEDAQDYRYFPEPDILTVNIPQSFVEEVRSQLPELPLEKLERYINELGISQANARQLYKYFNVCSWFESVLNFGASAKQTANLIIGTVFSRFNTEEEREKFEIALSPEDMAQLVKLVDEKKINITLAQMTLAKMLDGGGKISDYISPEDIKGVDDSELEKLCRQAIEANPQAVADFKAGKEKAIFALYGFIKRATQGKADIQQADAIIKNLLK